MKTNENRDLERQLLRVRLPHVLQFLQDEQCDVIGLQETKVDDDKFPEDEIRKLGYSCLFSGHKAYNGVAILTRDESVAVSDASFGIPGYRILRSVLPRRPLRLSQERRSGSSAVISQTVRPRARREVSL